MFEILGLIALAQFGGEVQTDRGTLRVNVSLTISSAQVASVDSTVLDAELGAIAVNIAGFSTGTGSAPYTERFIVFNDAGSSQPVMFTFLEDKYIYTAEPNVIVMRWPEDWPIPDHDELAFMLTMFRGIDALARSDK